MYVCVYIYIYIYIYTHAAPCTSRTPVIRRALEAAARSLDSQSTYGTLRIDSRNKILLFNMTSTHVLLFAGYTHDNIASRKKDVFLASAMYS